MNNKNINLEKFVIPTWYVIQKRLSYIVVYESVQGGERGYMEFHKASYDSRIFLYVGEGSIIIIFSKCF